MLSLRQGSRVAEYVMAWVRNVELSPNAAYNVALDFGFSDASKTTCNPQKFAESVRFAAIIRRAHGLEAFEEFLKEIEAKGD